MATLNLRNFDEDTRRRFKTLCVSREKTMTDEIQRLILKELALAEKTEDKNRKVKGD